MDVKELQGMEAEELVGKVHELKQELFHLRCQHALGRIENPMKIRQARKDVARAKTVLHEKRVSGRSKSED
ncbi:MAG: 50S ribosomal protein L29 [Nitrospira sp.]|nr:50S ribosomal protein L29 [Nitrospira sp.]